MTGICHIINAWLLVITFDSSRCRNSEMNLTFLTNTSLSLWESVTGISQNTDQLIVLFRSERNIAREQDVAGRTDIREEWSVRPIFSAVVSKLLSGCASGIQLSSRGSTGALPWPTYVGFLLKTNCKDRTDHRHTLPCLWGRMQPENSAQNGPSLSSWIIFIERGNLWGFLQLPSICWYSQNDLNACGMKSCVGSPVKAHVGHYSYGSTRKRLNETMWMKSEATKFQVSNKVYFCIERMCICVGLISHLIYLLTVSTEIL